MLDTRQKLCLVRLRMRRPLGSCHKERTRLAMQYERSERKPRQSTTDVPLGSSGVDTSAITLASSGFYFVRRYASTGWWPTDRSRTTATWRRHKEARCLTRRLTEERPYHRLARTARRNSVGRESKERSKVLGFYAPETRSDYLARRSGGLRGSLFNSRGSLTHNYIFRPFLIDTVSISFLPALCIIIFS